MSNSIKRICDECGKEYTLCPSCVDTGVFKWRMHYCSNTCFRKKIRRDIEVNDNIKEESGINMRIQYKGLTYKIKDYNLKSGIYITSNDIELKENEIDGFILELAEFKKIKEFKITKPRKKVIDTEDELKED